MFVGMDSSKNLSCTGMVSGSEIDMIYFHDELKKIFEKKKVYPPFHWGKLTNNVRNSTAKEIEKLVNLSNYNLKFNILHHKKPLSVRQSDIISEILPAGISEQLREWLHRYSGFIIFEVDNDFNIKGFDTHHFIDKIFKKIANLLTDDIVAIRHENGVHKSTIKKKFGHNSGGSLYLQGKISNIKDSRAIQIIDIILGYVSIRKCKFRQDRLYIRKLC